MVVFTIFIIYKQNQISAMKIKNLIPVLSFPQRPDAFITTEKIRTLNYTV